MPVEQGRRVGIIISESVIESDGYRLFEPMGSKTVCERADRHNVKILLQVIQLIVEMIRMNSELPWITSLVTDLVIHENDGLVLPYLSDSIYDAAKHISCFMAAGEISTAPGCSDVKPYIEVTCLLKHAPSQTALK